MGYFVCGAMSTRYLLCKEKLFLMIQDVYLSSGFSCKTNRRWSISSSHSCCLFFPFSSHFFFFFSFFSIVLVPLSFKTSFSDSCIPSCPLLYMIIYCTLVVMAVADSQNGQEAGGTLGWFHRNFKFGTADDDVVFCSFHHLSSSE
jgi:hypothetical protein